MTPMKPVMLARETEEIVFAADQPDYQPLPAVRCADGTVITRWGLTWKERFLLLWRGYFYFQQLTFGASLQPILPMVEEPVLTYEGDARESLHS